LCPVRGTRLESFAPSHMRKRGHEDTLNSDHKEEILEVVGRYITDGDTEGGGG